ncbi:hypothetical protein D0T49_12875 [Paludibacter sp. 221]|uniref:hypothetical protein n=1 Tax=Paludibacter sp. 221 TaxID=2302939 RepID=UPI0013CFEEFB|nr:hypothetical protein [Paludibacter sp. 221]NDV47937.1 hypothetical protein [Paludibacter sp. 221]
MKKLYLVILLLGFHLAVCAQEFVWKAGVHSFFDNTEFAHSEVQMPQTMAGVHIAPELGVSWRKQHRILVGLDAMHEFGSNKAIDFIDPIAYYEFDGKPFRFYMGAFPRQIALDRYPRMFFTDSISNYRPTVNGLFWEFYKEKSYINVWLDWTSRQTHERHEAFFMGWSGRYALGVFYAQHFGYMFHFAGVMEPEVPEGLHDNGLILTSLGVDLAAKTGFQKLEINAGWSVGLERDRSFIDKWHTPQGLLSEIKIEYKGLGLFNTYYRGGKQQVFYADHANELYWGDKFYRTKEYNRSDLYINFFKTNVVNVKFMYSLHFTEQTLYHEQALYATFDINNFKKKGNADYEYIWSNWFK